jgi:excisionase family DNA binding protein
MEEEYFTPQEIAKRFKVTVTAVYNWIDRGQLFAIKLGESVRVPKSALEAFIKPAGRSREQKEEAAQEPPST